MKLPAKLRPEQFTAEVDTREARPAIVQAELFDRPGPQIRGVDILDVQAVR